MSGEILPDSVGSDAEVDLGVGALYSVWKPFDIGIVAAHPIHPFLHNRWREAYRQLIVIHTAADRFQVLQRLMAVDVHP